VHILIVDDNSVNLKIYAALVTKDNYGLPSCFTSSTAALDWAKDHDVDLAIVDYNMPAPNGLEFVRAFRAMNDKEFVPVLMVTADHAKQVRYAALDVGVNDFLTKPLDAAEFSARVKNMLALGQSQKQLGETANWLAEQVKAATAEMESRERETIFKLSAAAELRDPETSTHLARMANYCMALSRERGKIGDDHDLICTVAPLHDVGKIAVPESILLKPGKLTAQEVAIMQTHTVAGYEILKGSSSRLLQLAAQIALTHHEKFDGSGYPHGLAGANIPVAGRICAVSDVFDALTSTRAYKQAWTTEDAVKEINANSGTHFDPELVVVFNRALPELLKIKERFPEMLAATAKPTRAHAANGSSKRLRTRAAR